MSQFRRSSAGNSGAEMLVMINMNIMLFKTIMIIMKITMIKIMMMHRTTL